LIIRSVGDGTAGVEEDGTPGPQPPPTPPHASPVKNKGSHTPTNTTTLSPPETAGHSSHSPNSHPNAALDTLMPANIEPILIKPPELTSPVSGDPPKTPTFSPEGMSLGSAIGQMSPFSNLTANPLTPAGLDDIIQRLLTNAYNAKITKNFCLRTHEITSLCHGIPQI
jgi:hypothetical protein